MLASRRAIDCKYNDTSSCKWHAGADCNIHIDAPAPYASPFEAYCLWEDRQLFIPYHVIHLNSCEKSL